MGLQNSPLLPDLHYTNTSFSVTPCWLGTESQGPDLMDLFSSCWSCHEFSPSPSACHLAFYIPRAPVSTFLDIRCNSVCLAIPLTLAPPEDTLKCYGTLNVRDPSPTKKWVPETCGPVCL